MRQDIVKVYKTVHTWTGIVAGLFLFVAFYAGALTMFKEPIARWAAPPLGSALTAPEGWATLVRQAAEQTKGPFTLHLRDGEDVRARLTWKEGERQMGAGLDAQGRIAVSEAAPPVLGELVDNLHRTAGLPMDEHDGAAVMGVVSLLYALALVSGLVILLPSLVKDFMYLRIGKNAKRMWLDAHNIVGIGSLPFHLVIAWSAVVFGLHDYIYEAQHATLYEEHHEQRAKGRDDPAAWLAPDALLAQLRTAAPAFEPVSMTYRRAPGATKVWIAGHDPAHPMRDGNVGYALLDARTGALAGSEHLPGVQQGWGSLLSTFFGMHFGNFGGPPVRWTYFFMGLAGAFLFYSGNLLWIESRRKRQARDGLPVAQQRSARVMAALTVGVCLGCMAGVSLSIAGARWLHGVVDALTAWHYGLYYTVFVGAVAWAFWRGPARASVELLWTCSTMTALIPAANLSGWTSVSQQAQWLDATAAIGALAFALLARRMRRRLATAAPDSVWAVVPGGKGGAQAEAAPLASG